MFAAISLAGSTALRSARAAQAADEQALPQPRR